MKKSITINDGTSKAQLFKAINEFEDTINTTVLSVLVHTNHSYTLVEFDGICVTKWEGNIDEFINDQNIKRMRMVNIM